MKKIYIFYLFIVLCAFSCLEDANMPGERQNTDFPSLTIAEKPDRITYNSATLSANVESANGYEITARGFIYSLDSSLKENRDSISIPLGTENGLGNFKYEIKGLPSLTKYYYVAYTTNEKGTQYSNVLDFTTWAEIPTVVETGEPKDIHNGSAIIPGIIVEIGGAPIEEYGICLSLTSESPVYNIDSTISAPVNGNKFEVLLNKLAGSRTYYIRAYSKNSYEVTYGQTRELKTPEIWERVADFGGTGVSGGIGRISYTTFTISDYFYVTGGEAGNTYPLNDLWEYNPNTDIWSSKPNVNTPRKAPSSFVIGNKGYTGLGTSGSEPNLSDFYAYQQNKNEWSNIEKAFSGNAREYACSFSMNNRGYIVGGRIDEGNRKYTSLSDAWQYQYDGTTWSWKSIADFPVTIQEGLSFAYQNKAFIGLGICEKPDGKVYYDKIWVYNSGSNSWTEVSTVPTEFHYRNGGITGVTVVENNAYIIDGNNRIWVFNLDNYEWSKKSEMPVSKTYSDNQCMFSYRNESKNEYEIFVGLNHLTKYFYKYRPSWDNPVK